MARRMRIQGRAAGRKGSGGSLDPAGPAPEDSRGRPGTAPGGADASWPSWARRLVTLALIVHLAAVAAGAFGVPPSSELERRLADLFAPYHDLVDQGYAYRYYAEPPPTPVITASLRDADGRTIEEVRLPALGMRGPRMRHQRQLALANALFSDIQEARRLAGTPAASRLARSYARHLCRIRPACASVTLHARSHLMPDPEQVRQSAAGPSAVRLDLFDDSLFTTPEWIGDFACEDL